MITEVRFKQRMLLKNKQNSNALKNMFLWSGMFPMLGFLNEASFTVQSEIIYAKDRLKTQTWPSYHSYKNPFLVKFSLQCFFLHCQNSEHLWKGIR